MNQDDTLLHRVEDIAVAAGDALLALYDPDYRPTNRTEMFDAMSRNEQAVSGLRDKLTSLRPQATWLPEEFEATPLPDGEWWVVDGVEGNVNHVHGIGEWGVTITLVRDGIPVLAVVRQPVGDNTYTATIGGGAHLGDRTLHVSTKYDLADALSLTGQAEHGQTDTHQTIADSIGTMLAHTLLVRATVPSTFPLLAVASGHADVFWQYRPTLPGVAAGVLLASEAGAAVTRIDGTPWRPGSTDILVANPALSKLSSALLPQL